jgi:glycosyltransferase involved in cell wall biosynthesis
MKIAILHYSVAPIVGGVEAVIQAHAALFVNAGFQVTLIAGAGQQAALPPGVEFIRIPEMDSRHPRIVEASQALEAGEIPQDFEPLATSLRSSLEATLGAFDSVIVHNIFSKHFNLPLTAALMRLLDQGKIKRCISWGHDFTWTSPHSRPKVHPGYPWDLLRSYRQDLTYVTVSQQRQKELAGLFGCPVEHIHVVYNGVDPVEVYGLSAEGQALVGRLDLAGADLILLMPVRVTQAKNIELALQVIVNLKDSGIHPRLVVTGPPDPHDTQDMAYYHSLLDLRRSLGLEAEARFVYESGPQPDKGYTIELPVVMELYRVCDVLFMPSHREGFGMPILEAGMAGMPIFSSSIPATQEIGGQEVVHFLSDDPADRVANLLLSWAQASPTQQLRRRIRQKYTWHSIFMQAILPLLPRGEAA